MNFLRAYITHNLCIIFLLYIYKQVNIYTITSAASRQRRRRRRQVFRTYFFCIQIKQIATYGENYAIWSGTVYSIISFMKNLFFPQRINAIGCIIQKKYHAIIRVQLSITNWCLMVSYFFHIFFFLLSSSLSFIANIDKYPIEKYSLWAHLSCEESIYLCYVLVVVLMADAITS